MIDRCFIYINLEKIYIYILQSVGTRGIRERGRKDGDKKGEKRREDVCEGENCHFPRS
jgi:hypothetical protein